MRDFPPALRLFFYLSAIVLSVTGVAVVVVANWWAASPDPQRSPGRLYWAAFTRMKIEQGSVVNENQIQWRLVRLPESKDYVLSSQSAVGRYAVKGIDEGTQLKRSDFIASAPDEAPAGGAVITVEVKTEHANGLRAGARLAFVQDKQMLPEVNKQTVNTSDRGFLLVAVGTSVRDPSITILNVKVEADAIDSVKLLGTGQWHPVVLKGHTQ